MYQGSARNLAGYNNSKTQAGYNITDFPFKSYKVSHGWDANFQKLLANNFL